MGVNRKERGDALIEKGTKGMMSLHKAFQSRTCWTPLMAQMVRNLPAMQGTRIQSLSWEDALEKTPTPNPQCPTNSSSQLGRNSTS